MSANKSPQRSNMLIGAITITAGLFLLAVATGIVPVDPSSFSAPRWVLGACAMITLLVGVMACLKEKSNHKNWLAGFVLLGFGLVGLWIGLIGYQGIEGGLSSVSAESNQSVGRWVFGLGGVFSVAMAIHAFRLARANRSS